MWNNYMPESNTSSCAGLGSRCDGLNVLEFKANMPVRWSDNFAVARLDHDFGSKWHFYSTYRYYHMRRDTNNQVDIGFDNPGLRLLRDRKIFGCCTCLWPWRRHKLDHSRQRHSSSHGGLVSSAGSWRSAL